MVTSCERAIIKWLLSGQTQRVQQHELPAKPWPGRNRTDSGAAGRYVSPGDGAPPDSASRPCGASHQTRAMARPPGAAGRARESTAREGSADRASSEM